MEISCTMNHEIVPKSIDWLRPAQNISARHKEIINMQNMQNTCKICTWALQEERASSEPFRHHQSRAGLSQRVADGQLYSAA